MPEHDPVDEIQDVAYEAYRQGTILISHHLE